MEEENNRSSEAFEEKLNENSKPSAEGKEENQGEKVVKIAEQRRVVSSDGNNGCAVGNSLRGESNASEFETLASVKLSDSDYQAEFDESSHHLSEVQVEYSLQPLQSSGDMKDEVKATHQESKGIARQSTEVQVQHQIQAPDSPSKLESSPTSVTKSISSVENSNLPEHKVQSAEYGNHACLTEQEKKNSPDPKHLSIMPLLKTPSDGFNWRKYGQKQVKSPEGSRSYYRCTFSDCYAKKIECSDRSNRLIETVYRSQHNHDPPQRVNNNRENKSALPIVPVNGSNDTIHLVRHANDPMPSTPSKEPLVGLDEIPETKQESSGSDETTETVKEQYTDGPECKKRQKRNSTGEVESTPKLGKKPKYVVHAAGDVGISGDGYRWRKYGQKMVKGNPHPRNYYRCTSAGCPVRKHIERAVDNSNAVVITYKGVHDHDTPVPRKRNGPKSGIGPANSPISSNDMQTKTKQHKSQTQWSVDKKGELTGEALVGGEKASESTKTLLSVGFEIKPC